MTKLWSLRGSICNDKTSPDPSLLCNANALLTIKQPNHLSPPFKNKRVPVRFTRNILLRDRGHRSPLLEQLPWHL